MTVEGRWAVEALLDSPRFQVKEVVLEKGRHGELLPRLELAGIPHREVGRDEISTEAGYAFHRGVLASAERPRCDLEDLLAAGVSRLVIPCGLADPGNLGTVVRSAAAFGADGVVAGKGRGADIFGRKSLRASATALFRLPVCEPADLAGTLERLHEAGFVLFATSLGKGTRLLPEVRPSERSAVLFGPEEEGLPGEIEALCDERIRIPMSGGMDSLNVAASAAIVFYELFGRG